MIRKQDTILRVAEPTQLMDFLIAKMGGTGMIAPNSHKILLSTFPLHMFSVNAPAKHKYATKCSHLSMKGTSSGKRRTGSLTKLK